jgi:hypothetical protein
MTTAMLEQCPNCGSILDVWKCCPRVSPKDAAIGFKTCEPAEHPGSCFCDPCIERRVHTAQIAEMGQP